MQIGIQEYTQLTLIGSSRWITSRSESIVIDHKHRTTSELPISNSLPLSEVGLCIVVYVLCSNVNCFTLLDESCHFSNTRTIKIAGFQLEDLGLMVLYRMHMTRKFKDLSRKRTIISYVHHPLKEVYF